MVRRDARVLVGHDATVLEATDAALELLGLTFDELRALPPGALSLDRDRTTTADFDAAWDASGRHPIFGTGTARLLDGRLLRVRYLITHQPDRTYEIILERSGESVAEPPRMYTVGAVLSAWRAAERKLAAVDPDSPEWAAAQAEIEHFRQEYQRLVHDRASDSAPSGGAGHR